MSNKKADKQDIYAAIYDVVRRIPAGRVSNYGAIAAAIGAATGARLVGYALRTCPADVPAHRVVNAQGLLTGRHQFTPPERMQLLLEAEGITVVENQVAEFAELFWDPMKEINI